jgi:hypothetical protein
MTEANYKQLLKKLADRVQQYAEAGCIEGFWYDLEEESNKHRDKSLCQLVEEVYEVLENE